MLFKKTMNEAKDIYDAQTGVCLANMMQTIMSNLDFTQLVRYGRTMLKVSTKQSLNRRDLSVLDKIDALTYEHHGVCLKDALVTKARLKASQKFRLQFIDRDGLINHMKLMLVESQNGEELRSKTQDFEKVGSFLLEKLGEQRFKDFSWAFSKIMNKQSLSKWNLSVLREAELYALSELSLSILDRQSRKAIAEACKRLEIDFETFTDSVFY